MILQAGVTQQLQNTFLVIFSQAYVWDMQIYVTEFKKKIKQEWKFDFY